MMRLQLLLLFTLSFASSAYGQQAVSSQSDTASVFAHMKSCYENLVASTAGMKMLDKAQGANDPAKTVLALPGKHNGVAGVFVVPYSGSESAFQALPSKADLPKYGIKAGEPIETLHYRIQSKGKTVDLRYSQQVDTLDPGATRTMTDAYASNWNFENTTDRLSAPVIGQDQFGLSGSEIEKAFSDEIVRRVNIGVEYYKYILPQPGSVFPEVLKMGEKKTNLDGIAACEGVLKRGEFPDLFAAFDQAKGQYAHPTAPSGGDAGPLSGGMAGHI